MLGRKLIPLLAALLFASLLLMSLLSALDPFRVSSAEARTRLTSQTDQRFYTIPVTPPIPTPPPPVFSATLLITPAQSAMLMGQTLTVTVGVSVTEGCEFLTYSLTLDEIPADQPAFVYVDPPTGTVGPPVSLPFGYTLQAMRPGTSHFSGRTYSEYYCGDGYFFTQVTGTSSPVRVEGPYRSYFPLTLLLNTN